MADPSLVQQYAVVAASDRHVVPTSVRRIALGHGFSVRRAAEAALVASELCSNMLVHATGGRLTLAFEPGTLTLLARDGGPPIEDLEGVWQDNTGGHGALGPEQLPGRHGIGCGLGAIRRIADRIVVAQSAHGKLFWVQLQQTRRHGPAETCAVRILRDPDLA